jgi:glutathione S-transferase
MKLHGYFRSGASYRVRIALNLKGLEAAARATEAFADAAPERQPDAE